MREREGVKEEELELELERETDTWMQPYLSLDFQLGSQHFPFFC